MWTFSAHIVLMIQISKYIDCYCIVDQTLAYHQCGNVVVNFHLAECRQHCHCVRSGKNDAKQQVMVQIEPIPVDKYGVEQVERDLGCHECADDCCEHSLD